MDGRRGRRAPGGDTACRRPRRAACHTAPARRRQHDRAAADLPAPGLGESHPRVRLRQRKRHSRARPDARHLRGPGGACTGDRDRRLRRRLPSPRRSGDNRSRPGLDDADDRRPNRFRERRQSPSWPAARQGPWRDFSRIVDERDSSFGGPHRRFISFAVYSKGKRLNEPPIPRIGVMKALAKLTPRPRRRWRLNAGARDDQLARRCRCGHDEGAGQVHGRVQPGARDVRRPG